MAKRNEIRPLLFARIEPVETALVPDRLQHKINALEIFCAEQGFTVLGKCAEVALQDADYIKLEKLLKGVKIMKPKPNTLIIKNWDEFPKHMIESVQLIIKCKKFGLNVHSVAEFENPKDELLSGFDEED